ncbi:MAG: DUF1416 domain-containing protein [Actinomycetota bacterium]
MPFARSWPSPAKLRSRPAKARARSDWRRSLPRLTGTVLLRGERADGAYVQIQNLAGDFQAEVRTDPAGRFVLHPIRGRWRLVSWLPAGGRTELEVEVGTRGPTGRDQPGLMGLLLTPKPRVKRGQPLIQRKQFISLVLSHRCPPVRR